MKTKTKVWLTIAVLFIFGGLALAGIGIAFGATPNFTYFYSNGHINFKKGSEDLVYNTVEIDDFSRLTVSSNTIDVRIVENADKNCIIYNVPEDSVPTVTGTDSLKIEVPVKDNVFFFNFGDVNMDEDPYIIVNIHNGNKVRDFDINSSTGDISIENTSFNGSIKASTGDIRISSVTTGDIKIETSTGDIHLSDIDSAQVKVQTSTGESHFNDLTADGMTIKTSNGDVSITDSDIDTIKLDGSTSDFKVAGSALRDINVKVSTGDCKLDLTGDISDYSCSLSSSTGDIHYGGKEFEKRYSAENGGNGSVVITTSTGEIKVNFNK
ncbi:MAG: DUF4097 domain-containing protein [Lachnospiraceae bacterium]|nr:DUF4097 domain-containing protein [Lachnospiraceae bacterium]